MRKFFADSVYWIALINPADQWFIRAHSFTERWSKVPIVTTNEVLTETLNYYAEKGEGKREAAANLIRSILLDVEIESIPSTQVSFLEGLELYESRRDKGYSLTDCISMNICRERKVSEILTHDDHFQQEGFVVLL